MKLIKKFSFILIASVCFVVLGYLLDSDPPYADPWDTIFEFTLLTGLIFTIISGVYFLTKWIIYLFSAK